MASIATRIKDDKEIVSKRFTESDIRQNYAGKTVFVTGSTGFVGQCLVEQLLRGCPDLRRIYLLVREKRGKTAEERIDKYLDNTAIAEGLVDDAGRQALFPCIVCRPSIVMSSWKEPVKGWCANLNGPGMILLGYFLGFIHIVLVADYCADLIPVDMVVNSMLVSMWDAVKKRPCGSGALVYNYGSSVVNPISYNRGVKMILLPGDKVPAPSIHTLWKNFAYFVTRTWHFAILHIVFHFFPAMIIDLYLLVNGKKTRALSTLKKLTDAHAVMSYFSLREWKIDITETNKTIDRMIALDHELFFCDVRQLDWHDYFSGYWHGLRVYALKDPMSTVPAAERKVRIITAVHYIAKYTILLSTAYVTLRFVGLS